MCWLERHLLIFISFVSRLYSQQSQIPTGKWLTTRTDFKHYISPPCWPGVSAK